MIMEKPSCIKELKRLAYSLGNFDIDLRECIGKINDIIIIQDIDDSQKLSKIKELCKKYGK